jgi:hypothetical protein
MSSVSEDQLMAYVDGELDAPARAQVERAIAEDPGLAARVTRHQALRARLQSSFSGVLNEPVPERLLATARAGARPSAGVVALAEARARRLISSARRPSLLRWAAIAASGAVGLLAGLMLQHWPGAGLTQYRDGALLARGELARVLTDQLAAAASGPVTVGLSFRDRGGNYCRTFAVHQTRSLAGLACRQGADWQVLATTSVDAAPGAGTPPGASPPAYRPAASPLPPALLAAVNERISGEALDAQAEAAARAARWRPSR